VESVISIRTPIRGAAVIRSVQGMNQLHHQALSTGLLAVESVVAVGLGLLRAATVVWRARFLPVGAAARWGARATVQG
jgi:hypothetical protein